MRTARLLMRRPRREDAQAAFDGWTSDPMVTRFLTWPTHASVDETAAFLTRCIEQWGPLFAWVIDVGGALAGMISVRIEGHRAIVGFALGRAFWGQGIATEAARAVIAAVLEDMPSVLRVWSVCDVENLASARVLEKAGMSFEGVLRRWVMHPNRSPEPRDCRCHALLRSCP